MSAITLSRSLFTRAATRQPLAIARRSFVTTPVRGADLLRDLYIREIRAYKAPQVKASDADAHVHKFNIPPPPPSPEEANLASELTEYKSQTVEVEGQAASSEIAPVEHDWFEDDWEEETPAAH